MTPKKTKKNDLYIDHFRKSTIGKEQTNSMIKSGKSMQSSGFRSSIMSFVDDTISTLIRTETQK